MNRFANFLLASSYVGSGMALAKYVHVPGAMLMAGATVTGLGAAWLYWRAIRGRLRRGMRCAQPLRSVPMEKKL